MIPGTLATRTPLAAMGHVPDPAMLMLQAELNRQHSRLAMFAANLDPASTPQGIADAIHDALTNLTDARQLAEVVSWGWGNP